MTPQLEEYILSHTDSEPELLNHINREVNLRLLYPRMCSGHLQGRVLTMLTAMIAPHNALEIGTYAGYSALCIAEGMPPGGHLDTVEVDDEMEDFIRHNFAQSPYSERITLHIGDAAEIVPQLQRTYDMAYLDADKRTYCETFRMVLPMIRKGGFIIVDNTLWDGKVTDPPAHDPQTEGIRHFNDMLTEMPEVSQVILPLRDGLTLVRVNP